MMAYFRLAEPRLLETQEREWERLCMLNAGPVVDRSPKFEGVFIRDKRILESEFAKGAFHYRIFCDGAVSGETRRCGTEQVLKYLEESIDLKCAIVVSRRETAHGQA